MTSDAQNNGLNLFFPYYFGHSIHRHGAPLLWFGRLDYVIGPWLTPYPRIVFEQVSEHARQQSHPLATILAQAGARVDHHHGMVQAAYVDFAEVRGRMNLVPCVGPGTPDSYQRFHDYPLDLVEMAHVLLEDPQLAMVASYQFIWRVYEYYLVQEQNASATLDALWQEEQTDTGRSRILAECLMNHYSSFQGTTSSLVISHTETFNYLSAFARATLLGEELTSPPIEFSRHQLASSIFDKSLSTIIPPITPDTGNRYCQILDSQSSAIQSAKSKCYQAADELISERGNPDRFAPLLADAVAQIEAEVRAIAEIDERSWQRYMATLTEDPTIWASVIGIVTGLSGTIPKTALVGAITTLLIKTATRGISEIRAKSEELSQSDWCFVYDLQG